VCHEPGRVGSCARRGFFEMVSSVVEARDRFFAAASYVICKTLALVYIGALLITDKCPKFVDIILMYASDHL